MASNNIRYLYSLKTGIEVIRTNALQKNQTFIIPPYLPHSILTHKNYTLLNLCIDKNIIMQYTADIIQNHIITLLLDTLAQKIFISIKYYY